MLMYNHLSKRILKTSPDIGFGINSYFKNWKQACLLPPKSPFTFSIVLLYYYTYLYFFILVKNIKKRDKQTLSHLYYYAENNVANFLCIDWAVYVSVSPITEKCSVDPAVNWIVKSPNKDFALTQLLAFVL